MTVEAPLESGIRRLIPHEQLEKIANYAGVRTVDDEVVRAIDDMQREMNSEYKSVRAKKKYIKGWQASWSELQFGLERVKRKNQADDNAVDFLPRSVLILQQRIRETGVKSDQRVAHASQKVFKAIFTVLREQVTVEQFVAAEGARH